MDLLGARPVLAEALSLPRWSETSPEPPQPLDLESLPNAHIINPFPVRDDLNRKIALWVGDIAQLSVEVVVNPTNENLNDKNPVSSRLMEVAGPELRGECKTQIVNCRTGEARITGAYKLPARHVIHTVGPRFNVRYKTAAESALYNCYRSVMQIIKSRHLATVAFHILNSSRRGYPPEEGAHIAIRTIRRFLEHYGDEVEVIVFIADSNNTVYNKVLPVYFPRTQEEEQYAMPLIPADIGDEFGEPIIHERTIRISDNPVVGERHSSSGVVEVGEEEEEEEEDGEEEEEREGEGGEEEGLVGGAGSHPFAVMTAHPDQQRREQLGRARAPTEEETHKKMYQTLLRRARTENFSEFAALGAFYKAGQDYMGRQVVVFVGSKFCAPKLDLSKAMAFFVHVMEPVVIKDYIIVYFHAGSQSDHLPDSSFFKQLYLTVDEKYKRNLKALFVVHPNWWLKLQAWWFLTFTAGEVKDRVHYVTGVQFLFDTINPDQLDVPQFVFDHDVKVNGTNYYTPCSKGDEASGGL